MSVEYQKHEFCKAVKCQGMRANIDGELDYCSYAPEHCQKTAKEFHQWLKAEGFIMFKAANKNEMVMPFTLKTNMGK